MGTNDAGAMPVGANRSVGWLLRLRTNFEAVRLGVWRNDSSRG